MLSEKEPEDTASAPRLKKLLCNRTGRFFSPTEHTECPYCFGAEADVESGSHEKFCDYKKGVDPLSFGLPGDADRHASG